MALEEVQRRSAVYLGLRGPDHPPNVRHRPARLVVVAVLLAVCHFLGRTGRKPVAIGRELGESQMEVSRMLQRPFSRPRDEVGTAG